MEHRIDDELEQHQIKNKDQMLQKLAKAKQALKEKTKTTQKKLNKIEEML